MNFLKLILLIVFTIGVTPLMGQEDSQLDKRSEIKINGLYLLLGAVEVDYEYIINEESSFGVSATYVYEEFSDWKWGVTPHYRLFFGSKTALGFFVEGSGTVLRYVDYDYTFNPNTGFGMSTEETRTTAGLGLAIGGKFKTSRDVVVEVYGGLGRILGEESSASYPRLGINIGKRF